MCEQCSPKRYRTAFPRHSDCYSLNAEGVAEWYQKWPQSQFLLNGSVSALVFIKWRVRIPGTAVFSFNIMFMCLFVLPSFL